MSKTKMFLLQTFFEMLRYLPLLAGGQPAVALTLVNILTWGTVYYFRPFQVSVYNFVSVVAIFCCLLTSPDLLRSYS